MKNKLIFSIIALILVLAMIGYLVFGYYQKATYTITKPLVTMEIEGYGTIKMELYPDMAPNTVKNFIKLINDGYYNGLNFHRVEKDWLIQGGEKELSAEEIEYSIKGEFSANGYTENTMKFERGTVGLARKDYSDYASIGSNIIQEGYNSGYAQFFIMSKAEISFNSYYTPFGKVTEGMEIVDKISQLETITETDEETGETTATSKPVNGPVIKSITVDTFGVDYGEPEKQKAFDINSALMSYYYSMQ